jgi:hypothetical protein
MRTRTWLILLFCLCLAAPVISQEPEAPDAEPVDEAPKPIPVFNGTDINNWGPPSPAFSVDNGAIKGTAVGAQMLFTEARLKGEYTLTASIKFGPPNGNFPYAAMILGAQARNDNVVVGRFKDQFFAEAYKGGKQEWIITVPVRHHMGPYTEQDFNDWEITIKDNTLYVYLNDHFLLSHPGNPGRFEGDLGIYVQKYNIWIKDWTRLEEPVKRDAPTPIKGFQKGKNGWSQMESEHYQLLTQCDEKTAKKLLDKMEVMYKQYVDYYGFTGDLPQKAKLVLHKDRNEWLKDGYSREVTGLYTDQSRELASYWPEAEHKDKKEAEERFFATFFHEGNHQFFHLVFPDTYKDVPIWFHEGFSECFASYAFKGKRILFNQADTFAANYHIKWLRPAVPTGRFVPWNQLLQMSQQEFYQRNMDFNYSQAWSICAFLLAAPGYDGNDGKYSKVIDQLIAAYQSGKTGNAAYEAAFQLDGTPLDLGTLESEWKEWLKGMPGIK